jgi:hypothetical protein
MTRETLVPLGALLALLASGCGGEGTAVGFQARSVGRPDAAWSLEERHRGLARHEWPDRPAAAPREDDGLMDLSYHRTPVHAVVAAIPSLFWCRVSVTTAANTYMHSKELTVTARATDVPKNLAFEVLRAELEAAGLVIQEFPGASPIGPPHFLIDRAAVREATVPAVR